MTPGALCLPLEKLPQYRLRIQTVRRKIAQREVPMPTRRRGRRTAIVLLQGRALKRRSVLRKGRRNVLRNGLRKGRRSVLRNDPLLGPLRDHPLNLTRTALERRTPTRRQREDWPARTEKTA